MNIAALLVRSDVHADLAIVELPNRNIFPVATGGTKERPDLRRRTGKKRVAFLVAHKHFTSAFRTVSALDLQNVRFNGCRPVFQFRNPVDDVCKLLQQR